MSANGAQAMHILRVLSAGPLTHAELSAQISAIAAPQIQAICNRLVRQGYVSDAFSKYRITSKGRAQLPQAVPTYTMRPYVPERIVRRPGSDRCSTLPSRVAGRLVYPR